MISCHLQINEWKETFLPKLQQQPTISSSSLSCDDDGDEKYHNDDDDNNFSRERSFAFIRLFHKKAIRSDNWRENRGDYIFWEFFISTHNIKHGRVYCWVKEKKNYKNSWNSFWKTAVRITHKIHSFTSEILLRWEKNTIKKNILE